MAVSGTPPALAVYPGAWFLTLSCDEVGAHLRPILPPMLPPILRPIRPPTR